MFSVFSYSMGGYIIGKSVSLNREPRLQTEISLNAFGARARILTPKDDKSSLP